MTLSNLVSAFRRVTKRADDRPGGDLLSVRQFRHVLNRERARSDRSGDRFCLLAFSSRVSEAWPELRAQLCAVLQRRLRSTDELGWLDSGRIGAVLPGTPPRGAWKLAEDVCQALESLPKPLCQVYCYPSDSEQLDEAAAQRQSQEKRSVEDDHRPIQPLELLFAQSLPLWKRTIDVVGAGVGLLVFSPVFLVVAAAIKFTSPGPVIFRQLRSGRGCRPFAMYKFRSMVIDAEEQKSALLELNEQDGPAFKLTGDPRITRVGRFLRDTSLDELPQLWNVLKGDMSLVGPRPLPCDESANCLDWQRRRLDVTPGLTCIWQVQGRSQVTFNEWVRMDLQYVQHRSLWQDIKILLSTVPAVLQRRGAK
jgi:lipopolysaccharide/colanic/teichoic acid biosynthesis glycosyltransferase